MIRQDKQFTLTKVVDAPRAVVWRLWTDPAELAHWFHPRGLRTPRESVRVDLREGGRYAYTMVAQDGGGATPTGGVYLEVVPPERLVFTWDGAGDEVVVEVALTERDARTEVSLTVRGVAGHPGDGFVHDGWREALDALAEHAGRRPATPRATEIPRPGSDMTGDEPMADWADVHAALSRPRGVMWLATNDPDGDPHVRPVFAAWTGASFFHASNGGAVKARNLRADGRCSLSTDIGTLHVVVEAVAGRVTDPEKLAEASRAMRASYDWPTEVVGDELHAPYGAPTSGGPPFQVFELVPHTVYGFPTDGKHLPTRWSFGVA